jgi:hypothetical protein
LDGTASSDSDGDTLTFQWAVTIKPPDANPAINNSSFSLAQVTLSGTQQRPNPTYEVTLTVTDSKGATHTDTVTINVDAPNAPPIADAGPDQSLVIGAVAQLSGAGSRDPDGDQFNCIWTMVSAPPGSVAALQNISIPEAACSPRFSPDYIGQYAVQLVVQERSTADMLQSTPDVVYVQVAEQGGGSVPGGSDDCLSGCSAEPDALGRRWSAGNRSNGFFLAGLPIFLLLWQRKRAGL